MANDAVKKQGKRFQFMLMILGGVNLSFLLFFFLMRFYLRARPLTLMEWIAFAVNSILQGLSSALQLTSYSSNSKSSDGAVDILAMALSALLFAAFSPKGWIFTVLAPFVACFLLRGSLAGLLAGAAPPAPPADDIKGGEGKGAGVRRR